MLSKRYESTEVDRRTWLQHILQFFFAVQFVKTPTDIFAANWA